MGITPMSFLLLPFSFQALIQQIAEVPALKWCLLVANAMQKCPENKAVFMTAVKNPLPSLGLIFPSACWKSTSGKEISPGKTPSELINTLQIHFLVIF